MPSVAGEPAEPRFVVMLVSPGVVAMDILGPLEAFATANAIAHRPLYRLAIAGMSLAPVETSLGIRITPSVAVADIQESIDTLLVSGGYGQVEASCDAHLLAWLRAGRQRARRRGSIHTCASVLPPARPPYVMRHTPACSRSDDIDHRIP